MNYSNHDKRTRTRSTAESFIAVRVGSITPQEATHGFLWRYGTFIKLTSTACHYGGVRHWFLCPRCGKRVGILYDSILHCRHCANVVGRSSQLGKQARNLAQIWRTIERYNLDVDGLSRLREWHRPKGIHRKAWQRIADKHNARITLNFQYLRRWLDST
jgi:hypothetical protein